MSSMRLSPIHSAWFVVISALLGGCSPSTGLAPIASYSNQGYRLGAGDQVRIITFGEDQLTGDFRVDDLGTIALPLLGNIKAAGKTPAGLGEAISSELLSRKLLEHPSVAVEVATYRPVFVLGEVAKPGQYSYQPGMTMLTTVAVAGGFTYRAVENHATVIRTTGDKAETGQLDPSSFVAPGDVIKVLERYF